MDAWNAAAAIAYELNKGQWKAEHDGMDEIVFTNEDGERFKLIVESIDEDED